MKQNENRSSADLVEKAAITVLNPMKIGTFNEQLQI